MKKRQEDETNAVKKFKQCFPGDDGSVVCQHWNGRWIVFPNKKK